MTDNAVHVSRMTGDPAPKTESFGVRHRRSFAITFVIGALMAVLAPLQTNHIPFWPRLAYWQILMLSGAIIGLGVTEIIERWGRLRRWPWIEIPVNGLLIALPLTMIVMGAGNMFFGATGSGALRFGFNFAVTALISTAITALMYMVDSRAAAEGPALQEHRRREALPDESEATEGALGRFALRLPVPLQTVPVLALQAEDHYLRVYFADGQSTLILMRLTDALAELPHSLGSQTHRSWWVARMAVRNVAKADGRATLILDHNVEAPVSRSYYRSLAERGWLG